MNWVSNDMEMYIKEKEFIDTAVICLRAIDFGENIRKSAEQNETLTLFEQLLEKQFKGRMMFLPSFTYVGPPEDSVESLVKWEQILKGNGFKYVFYLTADQRLEQMEQMKDKPLFYIPALPLQHVEDKYKRGLIEDQLTKMMPKIVSEWQ